MQRIIGSTAFLSVLLALSLLCLKVPGTAQGQNPVADSTTSKPKVQPNTAGSIVSKGNARITGYVIDSSGTKAVGFASIALHNHKTNKVIDGTVADDKGRFTLTKLGAGEYRVVISFVSYLPKLIDNLILTNGQTLDLGVIKLSSNVRILDEVSITGQAELIEEKVDRLVYHADKDITAKGGDATDILRKVPMLTVDLNGNVSLRGSQNILVLINSKPSTIMAGSVADAMKQIPADQIKTVEVITSPSAKYDAEGSGGIINIITKKNSLQGLNLNVDSGVGNRASTLSLNGGYRRGKAGFSVGGAGRGVYNTITQTTLDQTSQVNGVTTLTRQTGDGYSRGWFGQYTVGFDYELAPNQSLTAGVRYGVRNLIRQQDLLTQLFQDNTLTLTSNRSVTVNNRSETIDVNVDYLRTYTRGKDRSPSEWSISTLYSRNDLANNFDADLLGGSGERTVRQRNQNGNLNQEFTLQTDYLTPIRKNQSGVGVILEFGGKIIFRQVTSDYTYLLAGPSGGFASDVRQPAGALDYHQNIAAGYLSFTYTTKNKYTLKGGLRYEHTFLDASTSENGRVGVGNYGVLVPSFNASKIVKGTTVKLAYNRRIQRPGLAQLNPNVNAANPQTITIGNPALLPELTSNVELGLSRTMKKTFVNATFFRRLTNNAIVQVRTPSDTLSGAIVTTYENIGRQRAYGTNLFVNITMTAKIKVGFFLNAFYTTLTGQVMTTDQRARTLTNEGINLSTGSLVQAVFKNGWGAQAFSQLQGSQVQLQGRQGGSFFYTMGVRKEFKNKKGSVGFSTENFAAKRFLVRTVLNAPQFTQQSHLYLYNRGVRLTFTYRIGKIIRDEPRKKARPVKNEDVKSDDEGQ